MEVGAVDAGMNEVGAEWIGPVYSALETISACVKETGKFSDVVAVACVPVGRVDEAAAGGLTAETETSFPLR